MATIQIRIDEPTKKSAQRILDKLGLDLSSAIKIYLKQITQTKGIPFPLITENGFTPAQEEELIKASNQTLRQYRAGKLKTYKTTKELFNDLLT